MTERAFARPKALYIEAVGIQEDGTEFLVRMRLEAAGSYSEMTLDMENLTVEDASNGLYLTRVPTGEYNVKIEFTRCRLDDPGAARMQVAVVVTHQGHGEATDVWGVFTDMAAAVAAVKAEGMYAYSDNGVTKLRGHGRNGGPFGTIEMFEVKP